MSKKCKFFGADPIEERNRKIFEPIGKYFKMAVGAISGLKNASVLGCEFPALSRISFLLVYSLFKKYLSFFSDVKY